MSDPTRVRIISAFDEELRRTPVPEGLRALSVRAAVTAPRPRSNRPALLALVAGFVVLALVTALVVGSHLLRTTPPAPAGSTTPPPARSSAAVAVDQGRGVMVLFGGNGDSGTGPRSDTWTWDGKLWIEHHPKVHPQPRSTFAMAYDSAHGDVVLFGGMAQVSPGKGGLQGLDDTWTWNGSSWKEMHPMHEPTFGYEWDAPQMQFDPITRSVLMYGYTKPTSEANSGIHPELWSWNGSDWKQLSAGAGLEAGAKLMADGIRVLMVGSTTSAWNGSAWTPLHPRINLPADPVATYAYDPRRQQLIAVNGHDTWMWNGATWARQHPTLQPPAMGYTAYMPSLHEVISWADITSGFDYGIFAWTGADWTQISPATVVPPDNGGKGGYSVVVLPDRVASTVRPRVTNTTPVLLPSFVPTSMYDARIDVTADGFTVLYQSDERDKSIDFGMVVPNPPTSAAGSDRFVRFRNALPLKYSAKGYAEYYVYNPADPLSSRWLIWIEPGTMQNGDLAGPGVPYFLYATGLTEAEFWQVANSLR